MFAPGNKISTTTNLFGGQGQTTGTTSTPMGFGGTSMTGGQQGTGMFTGMGQQQGQQQGITTGFSSGTTGTTGLGGTFGINKPTGSTLSTTTTGATQSFGLNQPQQQQSNISGFGNLGGVTTQTTSNPLQGGMIIGSSTGMTQPTQNINLGSNILGLSYNQPDLSQQINQSKKQDNINEIVSVIQNYLNSINRAHPFNAFKSMLYNRVPKGYESQTQLFQSFKDVITGEDGKPVLVDHNKWMKALQNNPNPLLFYPHQISSPQQLLERTKTTEIFLLSAMETIFTLENNVNQINNQFDNEIENQTINIKRKLNIIEKSHLQLNIKMEKLAQNLGKSEKNYNLENVLVNKLNLLKSATLDNVDYKPKVKEIASTISSMEYETPNDEKDFFKNFESERLEKNLNILGDMNRIINVTLNSLKQNTSMVNLIKNDLEHLKKYGKLPKGN